MLAQTSLAALTRMVAALLLIIGCSFLAYHGVLENTFVSDSTIYLEGNPYIEDINLTNIKWMLGTQYFLNWHPLTWLSFAIDYQLYGGLNAWGYHLSNLVLHAINSMLLFYLILLFQSVLSPKASSDRCFWGDTKSVFAALIASIVFAVHPQHVESVAWVAERKDVLFLVFYLASIIAYIFYAAKYTQYRRGAYILSLVFFVLSIASKPMAVTLPAVLLLIDIYPVSRLELRTIKFSHMTEYCNLLIEKIPFFLVSAAIIALTINAQSGAMVATLNVDIHGRILNAFNSIFFYITKFAVPINFSPLYQHPFYGANQIDLIYYLPVLGFLFLLLVSIYRWKLGHKALLMAVMFYLVTLSPVLGVIQVGLQPAADRYAYLPTIPLYMYLSAGIYLLIKEKNFAYTVRVFIGSLVVILSLTALTRDQVRVWRNSITLWGHGVSLSPESGFLHGNMALAYSKYSDYKRANMHYKYAYEKGELLVDYLPIYIITSIYDKDYKKVIELNLVALAQYGRWSKVRYEESCLLYNLGWGYFMQKEYDEAEKWLSKIPGEASHADNAQQLILYIRNYVSGNSELPVDPPYCDQVHFRGAADY